MSTLTRTLPGKRRSAAPSTEASAGSNVRLDGWERGAVVFIVLIALSFGLMELYSASALMAREDGLPAHYYALRQLGGAGLGVIVMLFLARLDYRHLKTVAWPAVIGIGLLLVLMIIPGTEALAPRVNGARRWLQVGIAFQPSELAKLALIVWTAAMAVKKQDRLHSLSKGLLPFLMVWMAIIIPILIQPNFSAALLILLLASLVLFAGGARIGHFILLGFLAVPVLWQQLSSASYRMRRIAAFLDPSGDPDGISYQIHQSLIAVGSGGVGGVGFGGSKQKFGFLPELHNDFLFSMIAEEWGFIGVVFTVLLFSMFALVGYRIARSAPDLFGYLVGIGMTNLIVVSALIHMGVVLALLPATGVNLPFMSYGRSGLLVAFSGVGVLLSIARISEREAVR